MLTVQRKAKTLKVLELLARHLEAYISRNPPHGSRTKGGRDEGQRVLADIGQEERPAIQRVSNAPPTMLANNPTSKQVLQAKACTHQCTTWHNMPGTLPKITCHKIALPLQANTQTKSTAPHMINDTPPKATMLMVPNLQAQKNQDGSHRYSAKTINAATHIWQPAH